jgi:hypothetical protein
MKYYVDFSCFIIEAENEVEAYDKAILMCREKSSIPSICSIAPVGSEVDKNSEDAYDLIPLTEVEID